MENFERDDAFFASVNRNNAAINAANKDSVIVQEQIAKDVRKIANTEPAKIRYEEQRKSIERRNFIKRMAIAMGIVGSIAATIVYGGEIIETGKDMLDTHNGIITMTSNANGVLEGSHLTQGSFLKDNSINDYKRLNVDNIEDVYIYMYKSNLSGSDNDKKEEMHKFIRSISYYDAEGNECFYNDFDHFLKINNFNDEIEFINCAKDIILQRYRNGEIKPLLFDHVGTVNKGVR